jgi:hypothetical protein
MKHVPVSVVAQARPENGPVPDGRRLDKMKSSVINLPFFSCYIITMLILS